MSSATPVDEIPVPTTDGWSDGDVAVRRTAAEGCAACDHRFLELAGVSHRIPEQAPEALAAAVLARIASTRPAGRGAR